MNHHLTLLAIPLAFAILALLLNSTRVIAILNIIINIAMSAIVAELLFNSDNRIGHQDVHLADHLSIYGMVTVVVISFLVSLYSLAYFRYQESEREDFQIANVKRFYSLNALLVGAMLFACMSSDLGWTWISLEATTLIAALSLGIFRRDANLQVAWNYLVTCSVGLILALMGIAMLIVSIGGPVAGEASLNFSSFYNSAINFSPVLVKSAFIFILVGLGTKMALAPMHAWLPDTIEKSEIPLAVFLSCALKQVALIFLLRIKFIVDHALGSSDYSSGLMIFFGAVSVVIAALFIINQVDLKRLLAVSSIESLGIAVIALALPYKEAMIVGLIFLFFQALVKASMFFIIGNIQLVYGTSQVTKIGQTMQLMPTASSLLLVAMLSASSFPPFGTFLAKFTIFRYLTAYNYWLSLLLLVATVLVFASLVYTFGKIIFFAPQEELPLPEFKYKSPFMIFAKLPVVLALAFASISFMFYPYIYEFLGSVL